MNKIMEAYQVIYQQHSVPVAVVAVAAEMDFLAEVHVDATVAL